MVARNLKALFSAGWRDRRCDNSWASEYPTMFRTHNSHDRIRSERELALGKLVYRNEGSRAIDVFHTIQKLTIPIFQQISPRRWWSWWWLRRCLSHLFIHLVKWPLQATHSSLDPHCVIQAFHFSKQQFVHNLSDRFLVRTVESATPIRRLSRKADQTNRAHNLKEKPRCREKMKLKNQDRKSFTNTS